MSLKKYPKNISNQAIFGFSLLVFYTSFPHSRWVKGDKRAKAVTLQMMVKFQGSGGLHYMGS